MSIARFGLLAVSIGAAMAVIALITGAAFFFQHRHIERVSPQIADAEFQRLHGGAVLDFAENMSRNGTRLT